MSALQTWLSGLIALGALYLVGTQGAGVATALGGAEKFIAGTETAALGKG